MQLDLHNWQLIATALAGAVTTVVGVVTYLWRQKQQRAWRLNEQFQTDSHTLKLCEALSHESQQLRLAAAALLLERLKTFEKSPTSGRNQSAIIQALIAATVGAKNSEDDASNILSKFIADEVGKALDAMSGKHRASPLSQYYWQRASLPGAYWKGIDARGVDFFGCNFAEASLRRANLQNAVLLGASLKRATLAGADMRGANFENADLSGANLADDDRKTEGLSKTQWLGANFKGALYDGATRFPAGFDPLSAGMKRSAEHERATA